MVCTPVLKEIELFQHFETNKAQRVFFMLDFVCFNQVFVITELV